MGEVQLSMPSLSRPCWAVLKSQMATEEGYVHAYASPASVAAKPARGYHITLDVQSTGGMTQTHRSERQIALSCCQSTRRVAELATHGNQLLAPSVKPNTPQPKSKSTISKGQQRSPIQRQPGTKPSMLEHYDETSSPARRAGAGHGPPRVTLATCQQVTRSDRCVVSASCWTPGSGV